MKKIFFLAFTVLMLVLTSCEKEELLETTNQQESKVGTLASNSNFRGGPIGGVSLSPYVVPTGPCYSFYHSGNSYETLVYVTGTKPYHRKVTVFGWRNGNMSSIPNTYQIDIPANSTTSSRVGTFHGATMAYTSIKVEISQVLKQDATGAWVTDNTGNRTTATIPVQNCYEEHIDIGIGNDDDDDDDDNGGGGIGFSPL